MKCSIVVAASENLVIGRNNDLVWNLPRDLRFFMRLTMGGAMLMGRKTFESLGTPLKGRKHLVVSRKMELHHELVSTFPSVTHAIQHAESEGISELFVTGGGHIYQYCLENNLIDKVFLTTVHGQFDGDTFFKGFNPLNWNLISSVHYGADDKNSYGMTFQQFERA